ncbi:hypothetical protein [Chondromyces apiculatus]|uniref:Uncharacterized protein n=1 Tax=Chondromyces apiculatus DSM 436 TaxID=1192034 RepID=A0A017SV52_9BACT|nr:hypothetical protein [Chondromyces apiculatus]EYF00854.1 Hypothetical protein CAP_8943 [Chondromyces apiculatus DSM 436]
MTRWVLVLVIVGLHVLAAFIGALLRRRRARRLRQKAALLRQKAPLQRGAR